MLRMIWDYLSQARHQEFKDKLHEFKLSCPID